jgi:SAM-dependent methyltransferase
LTGDRDPESRVGPAHRALARIDREFYLRHADGFDRTRGAPWPGWAPIAEWALGRFRSDGGRLSLLDLGCGNGRFGAYLAGRSQAPIVELGVDASLPLLARARAAAQRTGRQARWLALDLLGELGAGVGLTAIVGRFDLVVVFGLMHHVPGSHRRARLLHDAGALVAAGGRLAVSFWQLGDDPRFAPRLVDARAHLAARGEPTAGLEAGDHLLRWGASPAPESPLRYCHHTSDDEADRLAQASALRVVERYHADGRTGELNLYVVLAR